MIPFTFDVKEDIRKRNNLSKRGFNKIFKEGLKFVIARWHEEKLKTHFTRTAYNKYPEYKSAFKRKKKGRPLVLSGALRDNVTDKSKVEISGTANKARLRMKFGRPGRVPAEVLDAMVFIKMEVDNLSYEEASKRVFSRRGYSALTKRAFQILITATDQIDRDFMNRELEKFIVKEFKKKGRIKRTKIK